MRVIRRTGVPAMRRLALLLSLGAVTSAACMLGASPAQAQGLTAYEQTLVSYDQQCEQLAVDDCATYDPAGYDSGWPTFEDAVTGADFVPSTGIVSGGYSVTTLTQQQWTCDGDVTDPLVGPRSPGSSQTVIVGLAYQACNGSFGWQRQRVIAAIQWKHTKRFQRDEWVTVAQGNSGLSYEPYEDQTAQNSCPGTRKRTFRTAGVGTATDDTYGGRYGGGYNESPEFKLPCDRTSPY